jgi:hypothetical protein
MTGQFNLKKSRSIINGAIMAVIPNTIPILAILEPITFPIAISGLLSRAACILTKSSGAEVAKETTVKPITILEILNLNESATEDLTKNSPPTTKNKNPKKIKSMLMLQ